MNEYLRLLRESFMKNNSVVCFGMDPDIDRMRFRSMDRLYMRIAGYFIEIMEGIRDRISAVKPNIGYYLRYGEEGLKALNEILKKARDFSLPIILDIKAGDIGKTSKAYAEFAFKQLKVDAVTLNPYLGIGALAPFFEYREKGFYILTLTSNPEAREIEYLLTEGGKKVYEHVFSSVIELNRKNPGAGVVIGATQGAETGALIKDLAETDRIIPVLIPGVGSQGGDYKKIIFWFRSYGYPEFSVRINLSSHIAYAHERFKGLGWVEAARKAVEELE